MATTSSSDPFYFEYWIGENIDLEKYWSAFSEGEKQGYIKKFKSDEYSILEIIFESPENNLPLFNLEPIYKTIKSLYYDFKKQTLSPTEFGNVGPIYLYEIKRGTSHWIWFIPSQHQIEFIHHIMDVVAQHAVGETGVYLLKQGIKSIRYSLKPVKDKINKAIKNLVDYNNSSKPTTKKNAKRGNRKRKKKKENSKKKK